MTIRLSLLHTFVAVARVGRMRDAAEQMALTPGAISQRIRELEEGAGRRLFQRTQAGVELTAAGRKLMDALDGPFRRIEAVGRELTASPSGRVTITTLASFAANWLVPRLADFTRLNPGIDIALETDNRVVDLKREPIDLAIRHGLGDYPGLETIWLMAPELIVVASPALLGAHPPIASPADCLAFSLLHDIDRADWRLWLAAQGVPVSRELKGPSFSDDHLLVRAAAAGQGLALVRDVYADDELRSGRLRQAIAVQWPTQLAYYAVGTAEALQKPAVRRFRDWLVAAARTS
ncbi:LysR family transcriptional regulator [Bosea sp. F3-2]|uniref:LysR substrate-binding domain-containing protein n=1 Tax=Bosea sp. F3-2 TaxID=2599640 RepID=UPI0011ECE46D|nr:LysR substrate-binding domain-containing protein [Bosea sp. F3-2]QEL24516.1 LysR family transcriptional regulator [Bosea sp. F3-2]